MAEEKTIKTDNIEEAKIINDPPKVPEVVTEFINNQDYYLLITKEQLKTLLEKLETANQERKVLYKTAFSIMDLFGFIDKQTGTMKQEIASGEESFVPGMLKSLMDVTGKLLKVKASFTKKAKEEAEADLAQQFAFIKELLPIILKYGQNGNK